MVEDLTVLLVGDDEPDEKLVQQLEKKNLAVEFSAKDELGSLIALVEPHIVVHIGKEGAQETVNLLKETEEVRRVRLIVLADRGDLVGLRQLDRSVVVSLLATDIAPSVVAARVLMLAKKGPEKSLRPPSAVAKPPAKKAPPQSPVKKPDAPPPPAMAAPAPIEAPKSTAAKKAEVPGPKPASIAMKQPKAAPPRAASLKQKDPAAADQDASLNSEKTKEKSPSPPRAVAQKSPTWPKGEAVQKQEAAPLQQTENRRDSEAPESELPTMAIDLSIPDAARPSSVEARVVLADDDVTRADLIACALRAANVPTRIVPLDAAKTHWALVRQFAPTIVMGDGEALKTTGKVWLQLFQADQALRQAKLVAVPFERLCKTDTATVNLRTLIPQIPQLSPELDESGQPTRAPVPPREPTSSPHHSAPLVEAPVPFADDDPDEFERLTVARPVDAPLPTEATRSRLPDLPQPGPAAGVPAAPPALLPNDIDEAEAISVRSFRPDGPRPVFDSLAPGTGPLESDTPKTPAATEAPRVEPSPKKSGGAAKWVAFAAVLLMAGGAAGWVVTGQKIPPALKALIHRAPPNPTPSSPSKADPATVQEKLPPPTELAPPEPPPDAEPTLTAEQQLWRVPESPAPSCDDLVNNLEELKVGGLQQANVSLSRARKAMVRGELDEALTLMCEAVLVHSESLALEELSALYLTKGSPKQALEWYEKAAAARPDRQRTLELGGDIHSQLGNVEDARKAFVQSLKVEEDDTKTLKAVSKQFTEQAEQKLRSGAFKKAALLFRRAAALDSENADAFAGLAATSAAAGNAEEASRWAQRTLSIDESQHVALIVEAAIATEEGEIKKANELTEKALERNPNYLPAHQLLQRLKSL